MAQKRTHVPHEWEKFDLDLRGILMVVGRPDVGKTTFSRYLYERLAALALRVAYLDGDPGQTNLGPPATMTLATMANGDPSFPPKERQLRYFVGSVSPRGHMLQILTGAARLAKAAQEAGTEAIIYDTTGLVDPAQGGVNLKMAKIDVLRPTALFAIQNQRELEPLLTPLRHSRRVHIVDLPPSPAAQSRNVLTRRGHRASKFAHYFSKAHLLKAEWPRYAVFPSSRFELNLLVAMEDDNAFTVGLGIVQQIDRQSRTVTFHTPLTSMKGVNAIRLGNMMVDPRTYEDHQIAPIA